MFVYIQQSTWYEQVFSDCGRYWKLHNEYHQHVQERLHVPRRSNSTNPPHCRRCWCTWKIQKNIKTYRKQKASALIILGIEVQDTRHNGSIQHPKCSEHVLFIVWSVDDRYWYEYNMSNTTCRIMSHQLRTCFQSAGRSPQSTPRRCAQTSIAPWYWPRKRLNFISQWVYK